MKKLLVLFCLFCSVNSFGQSYREVVTLKNGSIIKGELMEQIPEQYLKIRTKDGSVFVYQMSEVESIGKEESRTNSTESYSGLTFSANAGFDINTEGGGGLILAEAELGKRFTKNFYWGGSIGLAFAIKDAEGVNIPLATNVKALFPIRNANLAPFAMLKAGYLFNTEGDEYGGVMLQFMPGIQFPLSKTIDMSVATGYTHYFNDYGNSGSFSARASFSFHNSPNHQRAVLTESASNVFQIGLEGNLILGRDGDDYEYGLGDYGVNAVLTYKLSQTFMAGAGIGYGYGEFANDKSRYFNGYVFGLPNDCFETNYKQFFVRGTYRLTDKRVSPFITCDFGYRRSTINDSDIKEDLDRLGLDASHGSLYLNPGIGLSFRTTQNSYLDITASYQGMNGKWKFEKEDLNRSYEMEFKAPTGFLLKLGFTRTLSF